MVEALKPFIITYASARRLSDFPDEIKELCAAAGDRRGVINFDILALDSQGRFLKQMNAYIRPPEFRFDPEAQGKDFQRQLDRFLTGLDLPSPPKKDPNQLSLPSVPGTGPLAGVRMYLTFGKNRINHYRTPTVEAVPAGANLKKSLSLPTAVKRIEAHDILPWLEQFYPPAIMDGMGGFETIAGSFTLKPTGNFNGHPCALLEGEARFTLDNRSRITYTGKLSMVVEYGETNEPIRLRGVIQTTFPKHDPQGRVAENIRMTAAIESLPN